MKVTEKKFLNVHQTLSPLVASPKDAVEAAKAAAAAASAADKVLVSE